jgi:uroporphyrinogen-III synthase
MFSPGHLANLFTNANQSEQKEVVMATCHVAHQLSRIADALEKLTIPVEPENQDLPGEYIPEEGF